MTQQSTLTELVSQLRELINQEISGVFTCEFVIVEKVDHDNARVEISHKDDEKVMSDNVPILSAYAGDGYGTIEPIKPGDEGIVLFNMGPLKKLLQSEGHTTVEKQRRHSVQDAMFLPRLWFDEYEVPDHEEGERLVFHESETFFSIKPNGNTLIQHVDGKRLRLNPDEGVVETADKTRQIGVRENGVEARVERPDGDVVNLKAEETGLTITSPDVTADYVNEPETHISVEETGEAVLDGITDVGDKDGKRIDKTTENTDTDDPRVYEEVDEDISPIIDPTDDAETEYDNQASVKSETPVDFGGYEFRNAVPERRDADPDPTVSDPTKDEYFPADDIPIGYMYILTEPWELKAWGSGDAPVTINSI